MINTCHYYLSTGKLFVSHRFEWLSNEVESDWLVGQSNEFGKMDIMELADQFFDFQGTSSIQEFEFSRKLYVTPKVAFIYLF